MGWETFHLVQSLWLTAIELPAVAAASSGEKWELQVTRCWGFHVGPFQQAEGGLSGGSLHLQHASLSLLKGMLFTLDLAYQVGNALDKTASDRLQRRSASDLPPSLSSG